ncbi:MAG: rRNA maturation RNase YbeY [Phycisphaerales bacterium]|jgi:probable rRNA maturation factor|nr:rRNA maturation RNase YbeY [Phycisphaerales bacterium]MDP6891282.1 rRNA maturation RNase YbeY [Phycisphaerales bacterium]
MNTPCSSQPIRGCDDQDEPGSSAEGDVPPERTPRPAPEPTGLTICSSLLGKRRIAGLTEHVEQILPLLPRDMARVDISVIDDAAMIDLHTRWHGVDTSTDVITFEASTEGPIDVDIAICLDEADRAAQVHCHSADDELLLYVVHGLLHCCGFDDHDETTAAAMHAEEDRLLAMIGHARVYMTEDRKP